MRVLGLVFVCACATSSSTSPAAAPANAASAAATATATGPAATAVIEPRSGSSVSGSARFVSASDGLAAHVELQGAAPGLHGVHIHEKGDCSDPGAASAGGHYNPNAGPHHGGPQTPVRHGGDLGNLRVDDAGKGSLDVVVAGLSVDGMQNGVVGRSIVIHEKADDLQTDPAGNSGARIGCGVIHAPTVAH